MCVPDPTPVARAYVEDALDIGDSAMAADTTVSYTDKPLSSHRQQYGSCFLGQVFDGVSWGRGGRQGRRRRRLVRFTPDWGMAYVVYLLKKVTHKNRGRGRGGIDHPMGIPTAGEAKKTIQCVGPDLYNILGQPNRDLAAFSCSQNSPQNTRVT